MPEASARTFLEDEVINFLSGLKHLGLTVWPLLTKEFCFNMMTIDFTIAFNEHY